MSNGRGTRRYELPKQFGHGRHEARVQVWRMLPFANLLSEAERERIDRICTESGSHLGDVLSSLIVAGLERSQAERVAP